MIRVPWEWLAGPPPSMPGRIARACRRLRKPRLIGAKILAEMKPADPHRPKAPRGTLRAVVFAQAIPAGFFENWRPDSRMGIPSGDRCSPRSSRSATFAMSRPRGWAGAAASCASLQVSPIRRCSRSRRRGGVWPRERRSMRAPRCRAVCPRQLPRSSTRPQL